MAFSFLFFQAFADALLVIPKTLAQNAGLDPQETIVKLQQEYASSEMPVGIDLHTGTVKIMYSLIMLVLF